MSASPLPLEEEALLPEMIRADGGVRLRFGRVGGRTLRLELAESGGYRARIPAGDGPRCQAVLINTGGGMAGGDRMRVEAALDAGAEAVLTTQAAEKIYRSQGLETQVETRLALGAGAKLAWLPQETILYSGARLSRRLDVALAVDAELVLCEALVFGRAAMGEEVARGALRDRWRIRREGRLVFAEDVRLDGAIAAMLARPTVAAGGRAAATLLAVLPDPPARLEAARATIAACCGEAAAVEAGAGLLDGALLIRLVAHDAQALRGVLATLLGQLTGRALPRIWSS